MLTETVPQIDPRQFRATMSCFATGVTIISTSLAGQVYGMTANAFMSVSLEPPLILVSIGHTARMHNRLILGQPFGVSILAETQRALSDQFAGRGGTLAVDWQWREDVPLLADSVARIAAFVVATYPAGDHTLVIGGVTQLEQQPGQPLLFHAGKYTRIAQEG